MKIPLTQKFVLQDLSFDKRPFLRPDGTVGWLPNDGGSPYVVTDAHQNAPTGFAVKVGKTKKTYIIQRRVRSAADVEPGPENLKQTVGNVSDFTSLDAARNAARDIVQHMLTIKRNPRVVRREATEKAGTVGEILTAYLKFLEERKNRPIALNTTRNFKQAINRLKTWDTLPIRGLMPDVVLARFNEVAAKTPTAAEQTFMWAKRAVDHAIEIEAHRANAEGREKVLTYNPFTILLTEGSFRSRTEKENAILKRGVRRPLGRETIGKWFDVLAERRLTNRTAADYLILTTLWGTRRGEGAKLEWRDMLSDDNVFGASYVDLVKREVFFFSTKNRTNHLLPIGDAALEILKQRRELADTHSKKKQCKWVFPAESKFSKMGHYSDMNQIIKGICADAGIKPIAPHDMRRTFGRFAHTLVSAAVERQLLNHRKLSESTPKYNEQEWLALIEGVQRIELNMLAFSPRLYNMLLVPGRSPLAERPSDKAQESTEPKKLEIAA